MAGVNKAIIIGNLGKDPEARGLQNGGRVVSFSLATSDSWTDKASGERKEKTQWHRVVIFNEKIGEIAEKYLRKGSKAYVEGSIETRKYTDRDNNEREITEIVIGPFRGSLTLLGDPPDSAGQGRQQQTAARPQQQGYTPRAAAGSGGPSWEPPAGNDLDDEIPF